MSEIIIYQTPDNQTQVEVQFEGETFWLAQNQIADLFQRDRTVVSKHLKNIFSEGELDEDVVCANFAHTTKHGALKNKAQNKSVRYYSLDAIISVGYRVNSIRGTQFRQWASQRLKDYLINGYAINQKRLIEAQERFDDLKDTIGLIASIAEEKSLSNNEATVLLKVLGDFASALDVLDRYDHQTLEIPRSQNKEIFTISYEEAIKAIEGLKQKFGGSALFGNEKDQSFKSSLATIYQTFDGKELYVGLENKAAHLLYFVVKNHSFTDGNKRIAAFLFVWFLEKNKMLYQNQKKTIDENALVAITLMVASSKPQDKDMITKVIANLICNKP